MQKMTAADFMANLRGGKTDFDHVEIEGDVDFGTMALEKLSLNRVIFHGKVIGQVEVGELRISSDFCLCVSNVMPLCYAGSLIKDLAN